MQLVTVLKWTMIVMMAYLEWADGGRSPHQPPDSSECETAVVVTPTVIGGGDAEWLVTEAGCQATSGVVLLDREPTTSGVTFGVCDGVQSPRMVAR